MVLSWCRRGECASGSRLYSIAIEGLTDWTTKFECHLDQQITKNIAAGMSPEGAR